MLLPTFSLSLHALSFLLGSLGCVEAAAVTPHPQATPTPYPQATGVFQAPSSNTVAARKEGKRSGVKDRQAQKILYAPVCAEDFDDAPIACSLCGGEHPTWAGYCADFTWLNPDYGHWCKCDPNGSIPSNGVNSTTVINGETGIVCWEPITYNDYSNLEASTTMTITEPVTLSGGDVVMTTAAVDVYAGGVAWFPACLIGIPIVVAAIPPPVALPPGARLDDSKCDTDDQICDDCGGDSTGLGLCSGAAQLGCPCREKEDCPNEPPKCSECGGDNGQSQCAGSGDINGCGCCPDTAPNCNDSGCNGGLNQACRASKYDQCICTISGSGSIETQAPPSVQGGSCYYAQIASTIMSDYYNNNPASVSGVDLAVFASAIS